MNTPVWQTFESYKVFCAWSIFFAMGIFRLVHLNKRRKDPVFCRALLAGAGVAVGFSISGQSHGRKTSAIFCRDDKNHFSQAAIFLLIASKAAAGLAWSLQRDDIIMYRQTGELKYGLNYPDAKGRFVSGDEFANWLNQHRQEGIITLVLSVDRNEDINSLAIPPADAIDVRSGLGCRFSIVPK